MPNTEEQRLDLIDNCDLLLAKFVHFEQTDDTPEGRMKAQLNWLKERAENHDLPLPIDQDYLATLRYIYTDGTLSFHASSPNKVWEDIEVPMKNIISLAKKGKLRYKPEFQEYTQRSINSLIHTLENANRKLDSYETGFIQELYQLKHGLIDGSIMPPIGGFKGYPNSIEAEDSIVDIPGAKNIYYIVENLMFNGTRPDTWLTPEDAERGTARV